MSGTCATCGRRWSGTCAANDLRRIGTHTEADRTSSHAHYNCSSETAIARNGCARRKETSGVPTATQRNPYQACNKGREASDTGPTEAHRAKWQRSSRRSCRWAAWLREASDAARCQGVARLSGNWPDTVRIGREAAPPEHFGVTLPHFAAPCTCGASGTVRCVGAGTAHVDRKMPVLCEGPLPAKCSGDLPVGLRAPVSDPLFDALHRALALAPRTHTTPRNL